MESSIISSPAVGQTIAANTLAENAVAEYLLEITAEGEISPGKDSPPHRFSSNGVIRLTPKTEPNGEVTYEGWGERAIVIEPLGQCGMLHSGHGSEYVVVTGTIKSLAQASVVIRPDHREYVTGFRGDISMIPCLCPKPCNPPFKFQDHGGPLHIRMMTTESKGKSPWAVRLDTWVVKDSMSVVEERRYTDCGSPCSVTAMYTLKRIPPSTIPKSSSRTPSDSTSTITIPRSDAAFVDIR